MSDKATTGLASAIMFLGFALMIGLWGSGDAGDEGTSIYAAERLGQEIGNGLAHAACIEAGGEWRRNFDKCEK